MKTFLELSFILSSSSRRIDRSMQQSDGSNSCHNSAAELTKSPHRLIVTTLLIQTLLELAFILSGPSRRIGRSMQQSAILPRYQVTLVRCVPLIEGYNHPNSLSNHYIPKLLESCKTRRKQITTNL